MAGNDWKFNIPYLAKVGVGGSNPLARSNSINKLDGDLACRTKRPSAEFPRNVFGRRSRATLHKRRNCGEHCETARFRGRPKPLLWGSAEFRLMG